MLKIQRLKTIQNRNEQCELISEASDESQGVCSGWSWTLWSQGEQELQTDRVAPRIEDGLEIKPGVKCKGKLEITWPFNIRPYPMRSKESCLSEKSRKICTEEEKICNNTTHHVGLWTKFTFCHHSQTAGWECTLQSSWVEDSITNLTEANANPLWKLTCNPGFKGMFWTKWEGIVSLQWRIKTHKQTRFHKSDFVCWDYQK